MFDSSFSETGAKNLKRDQLRTLQRNSAARRAGGATLKEQRRQEGRLIAASRGDAAPPVAGELALAGRDGSAAAHELAPGRERPPEADPADALRAARLGFAAAVVLVLFLLWVRQRRG